MQSSDIDELRRIHEKHYSSEFSFDDFISGFISAFVIEENNRIISAGGIRSIVECVAITDKDISVRDRREALYQLLSASIFHTTSNGYNQLHAFIQDETWLKHLKRAGFKETVGKSIVLCV